MSKVGCLLPRRDAKTPDEYRLAEGYADDFRELVSGHRAKLASAAGGGHAQPSRQRHAGGRLHSKRGGKVRLAIVYDSL